MKLKSLILSVSLCLAAAPMFSQTLPPSATSTTPPIGASSVIPDPVVLGATAVGNIDTNVDYFNSAKLEIRLGAVAQGVTGSSFNSLLAVDYNVSSAFGIGGDIRNGGQTSTGMQSIHVYGELRHAMGNVEFTGYGGGGWNWQDNDFEGILGALVKYIPAPVGAQQWFTFAGPEAIMRAKQINSAPTVQFTGGIGYAFK